MNDDTDLALSRLNHVGIQDISLRIACDLASDDYPHILEFGVADGTSIRLIRELMSGQVFGFDTFTGLPTDWVAERKMRTKNRVVLPRGTFDQGGKPPNIEGVTFYTGLFRDTIPLYRTIAQPIALLHVDCDLYSSTQDVLNGVGNFLLAGSLIVFDEWQYYYDGRRRFDHEARAFTEWIEQTQRRYEFIPVQRRRNYPVDQKIVRMID